MHFRVCQTSFSGKDDPDMQNISLETQRQKRGPQDDIAWQSSQLDTPVERDRLLRLILETMPAGLVIQQKPGRIALVNYRFAYMSGYSTDQLTGKPLSEIVYLEDQNDVSRHTDRAIAGKPAPAQFTFRAVTKDNRLKDLRAQVFCAPWHDCPTLIWYIYDISQNSSSEEVSTGEENTISEQKSKIQNLNAALKVLMDHHESEKKDQTQNLLIGIKKKIFPYLDRIKTENIDNAARTYLSLIESNLKDLISALPNAQANQIQNLTYSETHVADLICQGKTSKEIAAMLNVSTAAISFHRHNLRKKMGLLKKKTTLRSHLQSLKQ
jgi:PAS domain S-box-containing protein